MSHHRLLLRQLRRHLRDVSVDSVPGLPAFLDSVNAAYTSNDEDRLLLERAMDISSEELVRAGEEMRAVLDALPDEFLMTDDNGRILEHRAADIPVFSAEQSLLGMHLADILPSNAQAEFYRAIVRVRQGESLISFEYAPVAEPHCASATFYEARLFPVHGNRVVVLIRDISGRKLAELRIERLAYQDTLTGLPNRLYFQEKLHAFIDEARAGDHQMAVLFLDADRFKAINDTFGHDVGDGLLTTLAERLRIALAHSHDTTSACAIRDADSHGPARPNAVIARMGGDEFTVLLHQLDSRDTARQVCERILAEVSRPIVIGDIQVFTSFSLGVAVFPEDGTTTEELVKNADTAMYHAKSQGRNNYQMYSEALDRRGGASLQMEWALRRAIEQDQLRIQYQPILDVSTGLVTSVEALVRWWHPQFGQVSPEVFVPLAEESDLIHLLSERVVDLVCDQLRQWADGGFHAPRVSINLSTRDFWRGSAHNYILQALSTRGLATQLLGVEVTETAMMRNTDRSLECMRALEESGIQLSLDDFGTGYASLGYLKQFPIHVLKIDRTFIRDIGTDAGDAALVRGIIALGHSLGRIIVAEGVETTEQLAFLREHGCDRIQGYLICAPCNAAELVRFVRKQSQHHQLRLVG